MADQTPKAGPQGGPPEPGPIERRLVEALDDPTAMEMVTVRLSIDGGVEGERFKLDVAATGRGDMHLDFDCALTRRRVERTVVRIEPQRLARIVRALAPAALADFTERQGGFPPCSLIGRLVVQIAGQTWTRYFMADPEQARTAGYEPPPGIMRAVEMLYGEAEETLGIGNLRP